MQLDKLLVDVPGVLETKGNIQININQLISNSRQTEVTNGLFFCVRGLHFDAHNYAEQAISNGCCALIVEHFLDFPVVQIKVENVRSAMAYISSAFFEHPSKSMKLIAISGTKGKTTTSFLMKSILEKEGYVTGLIGSTGIMIGEKHFNSNLTTPDPIELHKHLYDMKCAGVTHVCMEASAHAIDMNRLDGLTFETACFTNFSQDHLDYFGTMDNYFEAKRKFFESNAVKNTAINADDEMATAILEATKVPYVTYAIGAQADVFARDIEISEEGVSFTIILREYEEKRINLQLTGMFNVYNALAAASLSLIMGISWDNIQTGLESVKSVPGRIEMLNTNTPYRVILDYAHSPDALINILNTVRTFTKNRLIVLFGCGGDRDHAKRAIMGEIVGKQADFAILTSDNPRTEDPFSILDSIELGMKKTPCEYIIIENRRDAIKYALNTADSGDIIVLAGKGNETYQEIMGIKNPFNEKQIVHELLQNNAE